MEWVLDTYVTMAKKCLTDTYTLYSYQTPYSFIYLSINLFNCGRVGDTGYSEGEVGDGGRRGGGGGKKVGEHEGICAYRN